MAVGLLIYVYTYTSYYRIFYVRVVTYPAHQGFFHQFLCVLYFSNFNFSKTTGLITHKLFTHVRLITYWNVGDDSSAFMFIVTGRNIPGANVCTIVKSSIHVSTHLHWKIRILIHHPILQSTLLKLWAVKIFYVHCGIISHRYTSSCIALFKVY